ncbi:MAG: hydrogenase expression/formation protein HypE, partial [Candidatus Eremiobacterota bacterium]
ANEGKIITICAGNEAEHVLSVMKENKYGKNSVIIGEVVNKHKGRVIVKTPVGGSRILERPYGENLPRIC